MNSLLKNISIPVLESKVRRVVEGLFTFDSFQRQVLYSTFEDNNSPDESDVACIVQTLLGSSTAVTSEKAQMHLECRSKANWTWQVVLKTLIIYHVLIMTPRASPEWLQNFFSQTEYLSRCQVFYEDDIANSGVKYYSSIIKLYATYLQKILMKLTTPGYPYSTGARIDQAFYDAKDPNEILYCAQEFTFLLEISLFLVSQEDYKMKFIKNYNPLEAYFSHLLIKDAFKYQRCLEIAIKNLINLYSVMHVIDRKKIQSSYNNYRSLTEKTNQFVELCKSCLSIMDSKLPKEYETPLVLIEWHINETEILQTQPPLLRNSTEGKDMKTIQKCGLFDIINLENDTKHLNNAKVDGTSESINFLDCQVSTNSKILTNQTIPANQTIPTNQTISTNQTIPTNQTMPTSKNESTRPQTPIETAESDMCSYLANSENSPHLISSISLPPYPHPTNCNSTGLDNIVKLMQVASGTANYQSYDNSQNKEPEPNVSDSKQQKNCAQSTLDLLDDF